MTFFKPNWSSEVQRNSSDLVTLFWNSLDTTVARGIGP